MNMSMMFHLPPPTEEAERGAGLIEYALLVALIALVCIAAVTLLGASTESHYSSLVPALQG